MSEMFWIIPLEITLILALCLIVYVAISHFSNSRSREQAKINEIKKHIENIKNRFDLGNSTAVHNPEGSILKQLNDIAEDLEAISLKVDGFYLKQIGNKSRGSSHNLISSTGKNADSTAFPVKEQRALLADLPPQNIPPQPASEKYYPEERRYKSIDLSGHDPIAQFVDIYNEASDDRSRRQNFWAEYQNLQRFGNKNAYAQARGETSKFDFCSEDNGDFIAVKLPSGPNFMVVPQFGTTITDTSYKEGGFSLVFDCQNYRSGSSYSQVRVIRPAEFERRGEHWELLNQGKLDLQS